MTISVIIPAFNAASTIDVCVKSVLTQTVLPAEILAFDDGSTDDTFQRLQAYGQHVRVFRGTNQGVAHARNFLLRHSTGDLIAFLDADDVWHPRYLEVQCALANRYPETVAAFTGHVTFSGLGSYRWNCKSNFDAQDFDLIEPLHFLQQYNRIPGLYGCPSFCCMPRRILAEIGDEPFPEVFCGADDFYLMNIIPLYGPVAICRTAFVAYRKVSGSLSYDRLKCAKLAVDALDHVKILYSKLEARRFIATLNDAHAAKKRYYAKFLMGIGKMEDAKSQLRSSIGSSAGHLSKAKSLGILATCYMPKRLQPHWPGQFGEPGNI